VANGQFKSMRNKTMPASPKRTPGAVLLGDAFNMRHPLTGGGMTVAFSDVVTITASLRPLGDFSNYEQVEKKVDAFYAHRTRPALTINTLANALYKVFCASGDSSMEEMRKACFEYLKLGGSMYVLRASQIRQHPVQARLRPTVCSYTRSEILTLFFHNLRSAGPIALLGGLETNPLTLVGHFFSVALFGVGRLMVPLPTPERIIKGLQLLKGAVTIITPIVWGEGLVRMFVPSQLRERWGWI
jgi:squalene monooxygenase